MVPDTDGRRTAWTPVLSFGTAGCNLGCKSCQNWVISKSREVSQISNLAKPLDIALTGLNQGCRSVAFTYNDPIVWAEYALDTARACHDLGLSAIAVAAGTLKDTARSDFFHSSMPPISTLKDLQKIFTRSLPTAICNLFLIRFNMRSARQAAGSN